MYEFPPFRLDTANQCLLKRGPSDKELRIQLPPKAFSILQYLVDNADRLVTHNELMDKVWPDTFVAKGRELAALHAQAFNSKDMSKDLPKAVEQYKEREKAGDMRLSPAMAAVFFFSNLVNVAFSITVFCYIVLASVAGKIGTDVCNHLVFVLAALAVWFPCRAYADWFINLNDFSWIASYAAAGVLLVLFIVGAVVLALRMNEGSLYHRFVVPTGVISAVVGALAVWKSTWLSRTAMAFEGYDPIFRIALGLIVIGLLYYVSNTVHQRATS